MKYRIENVWIPERKGVAGPDDQSQTLNGRRIVHVLSIEPSPSGDGVRARVLTEEAD